MKQPNSTKRATLAYIFITAISLTLSYMVYEETLSEYNFGFAITIFSLLSILSIRLVYKPSQAKLFAYLNIPLKVEEEGMTLIQVPLSQLFLKDFIEKSLTYYIGLILCVFGTIYFQMSGCSNTYLGYTVGGLFSAMIYLVITSFNSIIYKWATVPDHVGSDRFISVKCAAIIVQAIEAIIGLVVGALLIAIGEGNDSFIPSKIEFFGLVIVGTIVPITYTLSARLTNYIDHSVCRAADGLRIILGALLAILFSIISGDATFLETSPLPKMIGLVIIFLGTYISFQGNPGGIKKSIKS